MKDRIKGALVGLACGDAVGTTLEFKPRGTFTPIQDMAGGGPFNLKRGQWTDDTSMALCLAHSLVSQKGFDPHDQMQRYCNWYQHGYMSSTGSCFDIGGTVATALNKFLTSGNPYSGSVEEFSSGNGSIMRLAPIPIFYQSDPQACIFYAALSSKTTHGSIECVESCQLLANMILNAFSATDKMAIFERITFTPSSTSVQAIANLEFLSLDYDDLQGSGYVIESLQSACWCFMKANSFEEAVLLASNLGNDADTTAAVCGQVAGAFYGWSHIPKRWREEITMAEEIAALAIDLYQIGLSANKTSS